MENGINEHVCNLCGLTCALPASHPELHCEYGLIDARVQGGYDSTPGNGCGALDDMHEYHFSLCEFCIDWLFARFRVPVTVTEYGGRAFEEPEEWRPAEVRVREDSWRGMKKKFRAEHERRKMAREGCVGDAEGQSNAE